MKKLTYVAILATLVAGLWMPSLALADGGEETEPILIQTDGSVDDLVNHVQSLGGTIRFRYQNLPIVAARIPVGQVEAIADLAGVTQVEKDGIVYLHDAPDFAHPRAFAVENMDGVAVHAVDPAAIDLDVMPEGYANFIYTGASLVWDETNEGADSIVAVVDDGLIPNTCVGHAVIGAPGFPDGFNATDDGIPPTQLVTDENGVAINGHHGTWVGGVIASSCALDFSADPTDPLYQAVNTYLGWPADSVPLFGQAPNAQLYPVKVFPVGGGSTETSVILYGLDHVLTLKKNGLLDIDIVNMSLGGPTLWDGRDAFDRFIKELEKAHILVVTSAGNEGPVPNSVGSPATSLSSLSVGALDYAPSSRVFYEYVGLLAFGAPGQGLVMRPDPGETRVVNFSSRGPLSDGRAGPDIVAQGLYNFAEGAEGSLWWIGGTSFSSPTAAGGAALLNAYWEDVIGKETAPAWLRNALMQGADPDVVGAAWQGTNDQGWGALDVPAALEALKGRQKGPLYRIVGVPKANVLPKPGKNKVDTWESGMITLDPSEKFDALFAVNRYTSKVSIEVFDVQAPDNSAYAYWPNALEVHVQSAKRTGFPHPVEAYWYPSLYGDSFTIEIEDGPWTFGDMPWAYQPMEPGLMKLSLVGDYVNESPVSFRVRITREGLRRPLRHPIAQGKLKMGEAVLIPVDVPAGVTLATFDLDWFRKWDKFPTSDIDMFLYDPDFNLVSLDGASGNAPERAVIETPAEGTWWVYIEGYEMYKPDTFRLYLATE